MLPFDPRANFASTLMFEKISNFSKKYFFDRSKNILSDFGGFSKINQHVRISLRFSMCNNMQLKEIRKCCQIFEKCSQNLAKYFWIDRKIFFEKVEKKFRTSISKQNFTADRMGALSASENHSKASNLHPIKFSSKKYFFKKKYVKILEIAYRD